MMNIYRVTWKEGNERKAIEVATLRTARNILDTLVRDHKHYEAKITSKGQHRFNSPWFSIQPGK